MMLSRAASNLYWIGRYIERAEFTARLLEATIRFDTMATRPAGSAAWESALAVSDAVDIFEETGANPTPMNVARYLILDEEYLSSIRNCIGIARNNARAARDAITRELWQTINRAWINIKDRDQPGGTQATLALVEQIKAETRGFEGAISRMLHSEPYWFLRLGAIVERCSATARLLDVKYHLILPEGEKVGGKVDRDQWMTLLQVAATRAAYRALYTEKLEPWLVAEMLILERRLPRSLIASARECQAILKAISNATGKQGPADRAATARVATLSTQNIDGIFQSGLHQFLTKSIAETYRLDRAISAQFGF